MLDLSLFISVLRVTYDLWKIHLKNKKMLELRNQFDSLLSWNLLKER